MDSGEKGRPGPAVPGSLDQERTDELDSRSRVLAAARTLFADHGFAAARVADIAGRAGMSAGNVYWLFDSKESILRAILAEGLARLEAMAAGVAEEYGPARRKVELLVDRTIAHHETNRDVTAILAGLAGAGGRLLVESLGIDLEAVTRRTHASLRGVVAEAVREGAVARADPADVVSCYLALFDGLAIASAGTPATPPRAAIRDAALRVLGYRPAG
jgi:AcrR family transcriptional regulator